MHGMGKDQRETENGKRSDRPYRYDLLDPRVLSHMAHTMWEGAEKGREDWGWRDLPQRTHLNHAMGHVVAYLTGDRGNDHLVHAMCRLMFAVSQDLDGEGTDLVQEMRGSVSGPLDSYMGPDLDPLGHSETPYRPEDTEEDGSMD